MSRDRWLADIEADLANLRGVEIAHAASERLLDEARGGATAKELDRADHPAAHAFSIQLKAANPKLAQQRSVAVPDPERPERTRNRYEPIGPFVASTYVSISATCPTTCPYKDNGCYAQAGASHLTMAARDRYGRRTTGLDVSLAEAEALRKLWPRGVPQDGHRGGRDLRLHVAGDVSCAKGAAAIVAAVRELEQRGLGSAWSFTARWREIPAKLWGTVFVLASVQTPAQCVEAYAAGYVPALTVERLPRGRKIFPIAGTKLRGLPCPFEAGVPGVTCSSCRLCLDKRTMLRRRGLVIVFQLHGKDSAKAARRLRVLNGG